MGFNPKMIPHTHNNKDSSCINIRTMDDTPPEYYANRRPLHVALSAQGAQDIPSAAADQEETLRSVLGSALASSKIPIQSGLGLRVEKISAPKNRTDAKVVSQKNAAPSYAPHLSAAVDVKISEAATTTQKIPIVNDHQKHVEDTLLPTPPNASVDIMKRQHEEDTAAGANSFPPSAMRIRNCRQNESFAASSSFLSGGSNSSIASASTPKQRNQQLTPHLLSEQQHQQQQEQPNNTTSTMPLNDSLASAPPMPIAPVPSTAFPMTNLTSNSGIGSDGIGKMLQQACQALEGLTRPSKGRSRGSSGSSRSRKSPRSGRAGRKKPSAASTITSSSASATINNPNKNTPSIRPNKPSHRLSLSEYRKAEEPSIRLTDADPTRCIHSEYDLNESSQCRILGHGASSTVRLAVRRDDGVLVAVKSLSKYEILFSRRGAPRAATATSGTTTGGSGSIGGHHHHHHHHRHRRLDECEVLKSLGDVPNVTALLDVFEDEDEVQLVMEYCPGGELFDAIHRKRQDMKSKWRNSNTCGAATSPSSSTTTPGRGSGYTEHQVATIVAQLLEALSALHERDIVHRDVKPENVLLMSSDENETRVKLSDFGLARYLHRHHHRDHSKSDDQSSDTDESASSSSSSEGGESPITPQSILRARAYSSVGSNYYAAPEVEMGAGYDTQCDVYSLGVTLYILLCGFPPSSQRKASLDAYDLMQSLSSSASSSGESSSDEDELSASVVKFPGTHWKTVSAGAKDLVRRMLNNDPTVRITAKDALKHEWIVHNLSKTTKMEQPGTPHRAPKKRSSLVLSSGIESNEGDKRILRRKVSGLSESSSTAAPGGTAAQPPPISFGSRTAFSMAELYNRVSIVAEAASAAAAEQDDDDDDESMSDATGVAAAASMALSV